TIACPSRDATKAIRSGSASPSILQANSKPWLAARRSLSPFRPLPLCQAKSISASRIPRMPIPLADDVFSTFELTFKVKKLTLSVKQAESDAQLDRGRH